MNDPRKPDTAKFAKEMTTNARAQLDERAARRYAKLESSQLRRFYRLFARHFHIGPLGSQRLKMLFFSWGYWRILLVNVVGLGRRLWLIRQFMRVDWYVLHGHRPAEMALVATLMAERPAKDGEVIVEAGCWRGGSTSKFSILAELFGYRLLVYDSFEGVETLSAVDQAREWHFAGQYACSLEAVIDNVTRYGRVAVCEFHRGWFADTLASHPVMLPVRLAYIDCDLAKGTMEAMTGVMPTLTIDGYVLSQDFHIKPVRDLLLDPNTWMRLGVAVPKCRLRSVYMAEMSWPK